MRVMFLVIVIALLVSCNRETLVLQSQYIYPDHLASVHAGTPDPRKENPDIGQRLIIRWAFTREVFRELKDGELTLVVSARFGVGDDDVKEYPIEKNRGLVIYSLLNDQYFQKGGIVTYKAEILHNGEVVEWWHHQVWTEIIDVEI